MSNLQRQWIYKSCNRNGEIIVHQCWDCDSEGEFYETTDVDYIDDGNSTKLH